jgi:hypothetical protein
MTKSKALLLALILAAVAFPALSQTARDEAQLKNLYLDVPAASLSGLFPQVVVVTRQVVNDFQCIPAPGNPPTGLVRLYCDNSTGNFTCLTSGGASCLAASGGTGTVTHTAGALTANAVVIGNGAADITVLGSLGTTTTVLHGNAAGPPSFGAVNLATDVSGNLSVNNLNSGTSASGTTFWRGDGTWATPAGSGTVTSVAQSFTGGLISVSGSPITTSGTLALTVAGTSGGFPYFNSATTWASSGIMGAGQFVLGGGAGTSPTSANLSGDVTTTGSAVTSLANIPSGVTMAGSLLASNITAPGTPTAGKDSLYTDSTDLRFHDKNASGTIGTTSVAQTCTNQVFTGLSVAGVFTCSTLTSAFTSGTFPATAHNLLSATHGDTTAGTVARGDVITGQGASATWTRLAKGTANQVLSMDGTGTDVIWANSAAGFANPMTTLGDIIYENATPAAARLAGCTIVASVPCTLISTPNSSNVAQAPAWQLSGVPVSTFAVSTTLLVTHRANYLPFTGTTSTLTLPAGSGAGFGTNFPFVTCNLGSGNHTDTSTSPDTIDGGAAGGSVTTLPNFCRWFYQNSTPAWQTIHVPTYAAFGATCANPSSWSTATGFACLPGTSGGIPYFSAANTWASSAALIANALVRGGGAGASPTSGDVQDVSNVLNSASATTQSVTYAGGQDASANSALGNGIFRGANQTGTGGASSSGGDAELAGGTNAATNAASQGGVVELLPGASTGSTQGLQGLLVQDVVYAKGGGTSTQWNLQCLVAATAMTVNDCGATPETWLGVAEVVGSNTVQVTELSSEIPINASAAVTLGHTVCAGSTAGKVTDSGGTATCTNANGSQVGIVVATAGTWTLPDGTSFTASTTLPLIHMNTAVRVNTAGGGSGTVNNCSNTGALAYYAATGTAVSCPNGLTTSGSGLFLTVDGVTTAGVGVPIINGVSNVTSQSTSQSAVTLATAPTTGSYTVRYYANQNAVCTTGSNSVSFTFNWTDAGNARSLTTGSLVLGTAQATSGFLSGLIPIFVNSGNVTYTSTVAGTCASGTSSYDIHASIERTQ